MCHHVRLLSCVLLFIATIAGAMIWLCSPKPPKMSPKSYVDGL